MTQITLAPTAGLCNRMNAILSAIALVRAKGDKYSVRVVWEKSHDCCARFHDLFLPIEEAGVLVKEARSIYHIQGGVKRLFLPDILRNFYFDACYCGNKISNLDFDALIGHRRKVYISSYNRFCPLAVTKSYGTIFHLRDDIEERVQSVAKQFTSDTVGIHIRRTDNSVAMQNSPLERFTTYIDSIISTNPCSTFFLSCDDVDVKFKLRKKYGPDRMLTYDAELNRSSVKGMKDAVAELYCLGRTSRMIGSRGSTFSGVAARLYDIPIVY